MRIDRRTDILGDAITKAGRGIKTVSKMLNYERCDLSACISLIFQSAEMPAYINFSFIDLLDLYNNVYGSYRHVIINIY